MILLPWAAFFFCMAVIIWQGFASKKEYFRRKAHEEEAAKAAHSAHNKTASVS